MLTAGIDDFACAQEQRLVHNGGVGAFGPDPHLAKVHHPALLQLEGHLVVDVVADVFFVGQDLVNGRPGPWSLKIGQMPLGIQGFSNFTLRAAILYEHPIRATHDVLFLLRARHKYHAVGLEALLLAAGQFTLRVAVFVDQHPAQAVSSRTALAVAKLNQAALPGEDLHGKLAAVFARHDPLDGFQQVGTDAAVVFELLAAILHADPGTRTDMLVVGPFISILKPSPAADVID